MNLSISIFEGNKNSVATQNQPLRNRNRLYFSLVMASLLSTNVVSAVCVPDPVADEGALQATVTNDRTYYLSELVVARI